MDESRGNNIPNRGESLRAGIGGGEEGASTSLEGVCSTRLASGGRCSICTVLSERVEGPSMTSSTTGNGDGSWGGISEVAVISLPIAERE